jgi:hypothetical protein
MNRNGVEPGDKERLCDELDVGERAAVVVARRDEAGQHVIASAGNRVSRVDHSAHAAFECIAHAQEPTRVFTSALLRSQRRLVEVLRHGESSTEIAAMRKMMETLRHR